MDGEPDNGTPWLSWPEISLYQPSEPINLNYDTHVFSEPYHMASQIEAPTSNVLKPTCPHTLVPGFDPICAHCHEIVPADNLVAVSANEVQVLEMPGADMDVTDGAAVSEDAIFPFAEHKASDTTSTPCLKAPTTSRRLKNQEKWASIKNEVFQYYIVEGRTLEITIDHFQQKYSFKASPRKWKMQMKEWNFDKNINQHDMAILEAKAAKRARDEGKETIFYAKGKAIKSAKLANFKKRRAFEQIEVASPSAATPMDITYETPRYESILDSIEEAKDVDDIDRATEAVLQEPSTLLHIATPGIDQYVDWLMNDSFWLKNVPIAVRSDLHTLRFNQSWLSTSYLETFTLEVLERAALDIKAGSTESGMFRYLVGIAYALKLSAVDRDVLLPHIFSFMKIQPAFDLYIWIAARMKHDPFKELQFLVHLAYGTTANVSLGLAGLCSSHAAYKDIDTAWVAEMHRLRWTIEVARKQDRVNELFLSLLKLTRLALTKPPLQIGQRLLSDALLELVLKDTFIANLPERLWPLLLYFGPSWPYAALLKQCMVSWDSEQHELAMSLRSSLDDIVVDLGDDSFVSWYWHIQFTVVASLATICGEMCFTTIQRVYATLLNKFDMWNGKEGAEKIRSFTFLCRSVYYASCGHEELSRKDMSTVRIMIETLGYLRMKGEVEELASQVQRHIDRLFSG